MVKPPRFYSVYSSVIGCPNVEVFYGTVVSIQF